jgi:hypothetical protein
MKCSVNLCVCEWVFCLGVLFCCVFRRNYVGVLFGSIILLLWKCNVVFHFEIGLLHGQ